VSRVEAVAVSDPAPGPSHARDAELNRLDHVVLASQDVSRDAQWYVEVLGLEALVATPARAVLSCDGTHAHVILVPGGPGLRSFALGAASRGALSRIASLAEAAGWPVEAPRLAERPQVDEAVAVSLPTGHRLEVVTRTGVPAGTLAASWDGQSITPLGLDHLGVVAPDAQAFCRGLAKALPFSVSEEVLTPDGACLIAFVRVTERHHEISVVSCPEPDKTMHHYALAVDGIAHMVAIADSLAAHDVVVEHGPLRHGPPSHNLAMYVKDPSGNRIEFCAEMGEVPWDAPVHVPDALQTARDVNLWTPGRAPADFFTTWT
jgi:catechol 2,3-dioxygenase